MKETIGRRAKVSAGGEINQQEGKIICHTFFLVIVYGLPSQFSFSILPIIG
ncbi:hypothetical protein [Virgibacillus halodenitrificans]|uniref:hypothetical protein n=1 Tax=Virgibacillus halodenitrificans TaxID=1482 RepID=UPI000B1356D1